MVSPFRRNGASNGGIINVSLTKVSIHLTSKVFFFPSEGEKSKAELSLQCPADEA